MESSGARELNDIQGKAGSPGMRKVLSRVFFSSVPLSRGVPFLSPLTKRGDDSSVHLPRNLASSIFQCLSEPPTINPHARRGLRSSNRIPGSKQNTTPFLVNAKHVTSELHGLSTYHATELYLSLLLYDMRCGWEAILTHNSAPRHFTLNRSQDPAWSGLIIVGILIALLITYTAN